MSLKQNSLCLLTLVAIFCLVWPQECPAPLVWRKGEGWTYERSGYPASGRNPKDQLALAKQMQAKKEYGSAISAYRKLITKWPTALMVQDARLGLAECLTAVDHLHLAFKVYQDLIEKHPNSPHFETAIQRQYEIGERFMNGEKHKAWGLKIFPARDKAIEVFEQVVKNGPYTKFGPEAQLRIGWTHEHENDNLSAIHVYEKLLDRYPDHPLAMDAQFQIGWAYRAESLRSEYDQNNATMAINAFTDYLLRYPKGSKVEEAQKYRAALKSEQSKGLFQVGEYYEKHKYYRAALIYYNAVIEQNPRTDWANRAQLKITALATLAKDTTTGK